MEQDQNEKELLLTQLFTRLPLKQIPSNYVAPRSPKYVKGAYSNFDDAINHFIKTSEYDENRRWYIDESEVGHGLYLIDYGQYSEILNEFKTKDEKFKKQKIEELQNKIPILYNSKKFKRTILNEIENRIILNPDLMKQARKELEDSSFFIHLSNMNENADTVNLVQDAIDYNFEGSSFSPFFFSSSFYVQYSENKIVDKFIFVISSINWKLKNNEYFKKLLNIIDENKDIEALGKIKINTKKMIFFHNDSLQTTKPRDYEEQIIECNNGTFSINAFSDPAYKENIKKMRLFHKELVDKKWTNEDYYLSKRRDPHGTWLNKLHQKRKRLFHDKYNMVEPGLCFYYINFNT